MCCMPFAGEFPPSEINTSNKVKLVCSNITRLKIQYNYGIAMEIYLIL